MKTINDRTVELDPLEQEAAEYFERLLNRGKSILSAIDHTSDWYGARLPAEFYAWLLFPSTTRRYFIVDGELFYDCDQANCLCTS